MTVMLQVEGLQSGYGRSQALFDMSFSVEEGQVVTLLGRNGMGKTTTLKTLLGLLPTWEGSARFRDKKITGRASHRIGRMGIALVPEGRQVFPTLSVRENLLATSANRDGRTNPWTLARVAQLFPRLEERQNQSASLLSGGEQQMLAIGRALMTNPHLLVLDEATEGLAPLVRQEIYDCLSGLKAEGQSILLIDKNVAELSRIADRHVIVEKGRVPWTGSNKDFMADGHLKQRYLGLETG